MKSTRASTLSEANSRPDHRALSKTSSLNRSKSDVLCGPRTKQQRMHRRIRTTMYKSATRYAVSQKSKSQSLMTYYLKI